MKRRKVVCFLCMISVLLSGCKFVRHTDTDKLGGENNSQGTVIGEDVPVDDGKIPLSELLNQDKDTIQTIDVPITENPVSIVIEKGMDVDLNAYVEFFFGESIDNLLEDGSIEIKWSDDKEYIKNFVCKKDEISLNYYSYGRYGDKSYSFGVRDNNGMAGDCYDYALPFYFVTNAYSQRLMELYPEEELDSCSSEEAIAFCAPLAEACGYKDAQVSVHAMTKEVLNDFPERAATFSKEKELTPPYSDTESGVTLGAIIAAQDAGNDELVRELLKQWEEREIPEWTDEEEAYLLIYRSVLNGRLFDCPQYGMMCIYVPAYNKVVWMEGRTPAGLAETLEETELITKEEALAEALRVEKIESIEDITLVGISMVYCPRYDQARPTLERRVVDPCWRIDYQLSDKLKKNATVANQNDGTVLINAVDGRENKYPKG